MRIARALAMSASIFGLFAVPAHAQDAGADAATAADDYGPEIVVTATRRAQLSQDVPIALSVVGGEALVNAGVSDLRGLRQLAPSLQSTTGQSSAATVLRIRGVGTAGDNPGFEPAVGVFVDGVFRARAGVALADLPPLQQVEVLRGPQGTLFGRNTSAGALNILTAKPEHEFHGYVEGSYGNYDEIEVKAGITGPVSDMLALRLDGGYHKRDGYIRDVNSPRRIDDLDRYFVRGQALFENDALTVRVIADYAKTNENCCGALNAAPGITGPAVEQLAGLAGLDGLVSPVNLAARRQAISPNRSYAEDVKEWGVSAQIDYEFDSGMKFTSITAYRDWRLLRDQDIDFSGLDRAFRDDYRNGLKDFTQELRIQGNAFDDKLDWLVGGFYLNETNTLRDTVRVGTQGNQYVDALISAATVGLSPLAPRGFSVFGSLNFPGLPAQPFIGNAFLASPVVQGFLALNPAATPQFLNYLPSQVGAGQNTDNWRVKTEAIALFTHNIINFNDVISLTLGARWNHETKRVTANLNAVNAPCSALLPGGSASAFGQFFAADPRFSGIRLLLCNPVVNPEFNGNYTGGHSEDEITGTAKLAFKLSDAVLVYGGYDRGYKSGGFNLDRGAFDSRYFGGNGAQITDTEFGPETVDSFEAGIKTEFSRQFILNATVYFSNFHDFQDVTFIGNNFRVTSIQKLRSRGVELESVIRPHRDLTINLGYAYTDAKYIDPSLALIPELADSDGVQVTNQPKHTVTAAMTWTPQISETVGGLVHVDARLNSDANTINARQANPATTNDGYTIVNARVGLTFAERYTVEAYVENLFNTYYSLTGFPVPEQSGSFAVYPAQPRFYGVKLRASF